MNLHKNKYYDVSDISLKLKILNQINRLVNFTC